ncbi:MAG TPA: hypothetical protein VKC66_18275 [Xanthobacteraceae bacterium]|nr:hypothetical protein [Xanthobacteraceae bacterium]
MLASQRHGINEELLILGYGFSRRMPVGLIHRVLAAAKPKVMQAGGETIEVSRIGITKAGRQAINV